MILLTAFSGILFLVPVFVTFGVYFGIEHERILRCGLSCASSGNDTIDDPHKLQQTLFCQKSYAITPPPGEYICTQENPPPLPRPLPPPASQWIPRRDRRMQGWRRTHLVRPAPLPWFSHPLTALPLAPCSQPESMVRPCSLTGRGAS